MRIHFLRVVKFVCLILLVGLIINFYAYIHSKPEDKNEQFHHSQFIYDHVKKNDPISLEASELLNFNAQEQLDYISQYLIIKYNVLANINEQFVVNIILTNSGDKTIEKCCWAIYFYHTKFINTYAINSGLIIIGDHSNIVPLFFVNHVNGYTFSIKPSNHFQQLIPGASKTVQIYGGGWAVSKSEVIPNWYVANDQFKSIPKLIASTVGEKMSFVGNFLHPNQTHRSVWEQAKPISAKSRYMKNEIMDAHLKIKLIIPTPLQIKVKPAKHLILSSAQIWKIIAHPELISEARYLQSFLTFLSLSKVKEADNDEFVIKLKIDSKIAEDIPPNSGHLFLPHIYSLVVDDEKNRIIISGASRAAVFYGIVSLLSLAHLAKPDSSVREVKIPATILFDAPRFEHRGVMVDVARNFHSKQELFKLMDALALYKLNVLHLHLADDEGWRIQIPGLPELTQVGGQRSHDLEETGSILSMLGSGPTNDTSGSGFYTVKDYQEILQYASVRHIEILPEIDMPGHSHAAIKSMLARHTSLKMQKNATESKRFLVSDVFDRSNYMSGQFFKDCALNPCIQSTYNFVNHVINEIVAMHQKYQPLKRFHFGGDEVPQNAYGGSKACSRFLRNNNKVKSLTELKSYFVRRVTTMIGSKNLSVVGWEDAYSAEQGGQMEAREVKAKEAIIQYYLNQWEGGAARRVYDYANAGYKVILSPITALYFDNPQEPNPDDWGLHWGARYVNTKRTFHFTPDNIYNSIDFNFQGSRIKRSDFCFNDNCPKLEKRENILGMEAAMWSELIRTESRMDSMLWPRMLAVAERAWHRANWEQESDEAIFEKKRASDWAQFAKTLGHKELKRLETLNVEYYLPRVGARSKKGKLFLNSMFPGLKFSISEDKGKTWNDFNPQKYYHHDIQVRTQSHDGKRFSVPISLRLQ